MCKYLLFFLLPFSLLQAQNTNSKSPNDSTSHAEYKEWDLNFWDTDSYKDLGRPTIEITAGQNSSYYNKDEFPYDFEKNNQFMVKVGFANYGETVAGSGLLKYSYPSIFYSKSTGDVDKIGENNALNSNVNTLGVLTSSGYGYKLADNFFLLLISSGGLSWNSLDFTNPNTIVDSNHIDMIRKLEDGVRFGEIFEAGINLRLIDNLGLTANYSENLIMPRHLFWYWALGSIIQVTASELADYFVKSSIKTSPELVPILNFVLQNGISYGFNRLREKNMNWPSETAPPIFEKNFNIGISFIF